MIIYGVNEGLATFGPKTQRKIEISAMSGGHVAEFRRSHPFWLPKVSQGKLLDIVCFGSLTYSHPHRESYPSVSAQLDHEVNVDEYAQDGQKRQERHLRGYRNTTGCQFRGFLALDSAWQQPTMKETFLEVCGCLQTIRTQPLKTRRHVDSSARIQASAEQSASKW